MKKYEIKDFLAGKFTVRCKTDAQKEKLMRACKENGIKWASGRAIGDFYPELPVLGVEDNRLLQGRSHWKRNYADFDEIDISLAPHYQIIIDCDGDTTTAKMIVNGKEVKTATAKRNPADKANWRIGAQTAFDRLWQRKEKQVEQKQEGGFKIGDRVVAHDLRGYDARLNGKAGTVVNVGNASCGVGFDELVFGHHCDGDAENGHGWYVSNRFLRHEKPCKPEVREVKRRAKVGEYIKLVKIRYSFDELGQILRVDGYNPYFDQVFVRSENHPYAHKDIHNMKWHYPDDYYVVLEGYKPEGE